MVKKIQFNIKIGNKTFYTLIAIIAILTVAGVVIAWNSGNPAVMGHSADEIEGMADYVEVPLSELTDKYNACCGPPGCPLVGSLDDGGRVGCCFASFTHWCRTHGYESGILSGTCGMGFCRGTGECLHQGVCIKKNFS